MAGYGAVIAYAEVLGEDEGCIIAAGDTGRRERD